MKTEIVGAGSFVPLSIRRAVERPIPVGAITSDRITPLSFFEAFAYT